MLLLYRRGYDQSGMVSFCIEHGDWMHVPRGWYVQQAGKLDWARTIAIHEGRSIGHQLLPGTHVEAEFGVSKPGLDIPPGQPAFIEQMVKGCIANGIGGVAVAPTRSGKTYCALEAACRLGSATLVLVDRDPLMRQWMDAVQGDPSRPDKPRIRVAGGAGVSCGVIREDRFDMPPAGPHFVVAMIQTLMRRSLTKEQREAFGTVIVDECDSAPCESIYSALRRLSARNVIGLSATPDRKDGLTEAIYWTIGPQIAELERKLEADVFFRSRPWRKVPIPNSSGEGERPPRVTRMGTVNSIEVEKSLLRDPEHIEDVCTRARAGADGGDQVLIFVGLRDHAMALAEGCAEQRLYPSIFMGGQTTTANLQGNPVIATYQAAAKGTDIEPAPTLCILAAPRTDVRQAMGRALQPQAPRRPKVLDYVYGHPALRKQARARERTYRQKGLTLLNGVS